MPVFEPGPSNRGILVIVYQFKVQRAGIDLVGEIDCASIAANYDDAGFSCESTWFLGDLVGRVVCRHLRSRSIHWIEICAYRSIPYWYFKL